jgi:transcriptional regulator with XRE-family HTH domain
MPKKPDLPPLEIIDEPIGKRIFRLRKLKGMTQTDLAKKIGIKRSQIADYELGRTRLFDEMVTRVAIALEVSADELLGLKDRPAINKKK